MKKDTIGLIVSIVVSCIASVLMNLYLYGVFG